MQYRADYFLAVNTENSRVRVNVDPKTKQLLKQTLIQASVSIFIYFILFSFLSFLATCDLSDSVRDAGVVAAITPISPDVGMLPR